MRRRLLIVREEDEGENPIAPTLRSCGLEVLCTQGFLPDELERYDLILLDLQTNSPNTSDVVQTIRAQSTVPVFVLSATGGIAECVVALELGADDYIRKPVAEAELIARVKALIRHSTSD